MIATKPIADLFIDANIVFLLSYCLWRLTHWGLTRGALAGNFIVIHRLMRATLICVALSPAMAYGFVSVSQLLWPGAPVTVGDVAVAAYLRGDIAIAAQDFEAALNSRDKFVDGALTNPAPWMLVLLAGLVLGALWHLARLGQTVLQVQRVLAGSHVWRRTRTTDVRFSDTTVIPFAARGVFRRHVVLPSGLLMQPEELRIVLAHELQHLRQGDVEWELAFAILRPVLFWNPAFFLWRRDFDALREMSSDQAVVTRRHIAPHAYAQCLLAFCERKLRGGLQARVVQVGFVRAGSRSARQALQARVMALQVQPGKAAWQPALVFGLGMMLCAGIMLAAASVRPPGDWSHDRLMLSTIVNLERMEAINRGF